MACKFDVDGVCHALACYSSEKCGAKSDDGIDYAEHSHKEKEEEKGV